MPKKIVREQCAVLAYRRNDKGVQFLLVTSLETKRWVPPKGNIEEELPGYKSAAREAFEEAGVKGNVGSHAIGTYLYEKSELKGGGLCRVSVYPMEVTRIRRNWPEKELRRRRWMTVDRASSAVNEKELMKLMRRFGAKLQQSGTAE